MANSVQSEPSKPTKPGFVGFEGSSLNEIVKIEGEQAPLCRPAQEAVSISSGLGPLEKCTQVGVDSVTSEERVMSWAEWKAVALNRLFLEQGTAGQLGRITAETVRHGER